MADCDSLTALSAYRTTQIQSTAKEIQHLGQLVSNFLRTTMLNLWNIGFIKSRVRVKSLLHHYRQLVCRLVTIIMIVLLPVEAKPTALLTITLIAFDVHSASMSSFICSSLPWSNDAFKSHQKKEKIITISLVKGITLHWVRFYYLYSSAICQHTVWINCLTNFFFCKILLNKLLDFRNTCGTTYQNNL